MRKVEVKIVVYYDESTDDAIYADQILKDSLSSFINRGGLSPDDSDLVIDAFDVSVKSDS